MKISSSKASISVAGLCKEMRADGPDREGVSCAYSFFSYIGVLSGGMQCGRGDNNGFSKLKYYEMPAICATILVISIIALYAGEVSTLIKACKYAKTHAIFEVGPSSRAVLVASGVWHWQGTFFIFRPFKRICVASCAAAVVAFSSRYQLAANYEIWRQYAKML